MGVAWNDLNPSLQQCDIGVLTCESFITASINDYGSPCNYIFATRNSSTTIVLGKMLDKSSNYELIVRVAARDGRSDVARIALQPAPLQRKGLG